MNDDDKLKLRELIVRVLNRCIPKDYKNFDDLMEKQHFNVPPGGKPTFLSDDDLEFIEKNPSVKDKFIDLCIAFGKYQDHIISKNYNDTTEYLLDLLGMSHYNYKEFPKNIEYIKKGIENNLSGTIEEILIILDLSHRPYDA